jgi:hypothetical protein
MAKHSAEVLRARPFEGKWTPNEIIGHLTDSEWVYGYRLRLILSDDDRLRPALSWREKPGVKRWCKRCWPAILKLEAAI